MNTKRCHGYKGHWECKRPDNMVPVSEFSDDGKSLYPQNRILLTIREIFLKTAENKVKIRTK